MDLAQMNIVIGANVAQAEQGLNKVSQDLSQTAMAAQKVDSSLDKAGATITKSTRNFTGLSRVIQDLPFGFIAISNNLEQLLPAAGAAGLAFSAIISALSFLKIGFQNWTGSVKDNKDAIDEDNKLVEELSNATKKLNDEVGRTPSLMDQSSDSILKLNENLKKEQAELEAASGFWATYATDIFTAMAARSNARKQIEQDQKAISDLSKEAENLAFAQGLSKLQENFKLEIQANQLAEEHNLQIQIDGEKRIAQNRDLAIAQRTAALKNALNDELRLNKVIEDAQLAQAFDSEGKQAIVRENFRFANLKAQQQYLNDLLQLQKEAADKLNAFHPVDTNIKDISKRFIGAIAVETGDALATVQRTLDKTPLHFKFPDISEQAQKALDLKKLQDTMEKVNFVIGSVKEAFDGIFDSIANGGNVFDALGQSVKRLVTKLVAAVVEAAALSFILSLIPGAGGAVKGGIGFGNLFSLLSGIPKGAAGMVVTRPTLALIGEAGPERVAPLNQISNSGNVIGGQVEFVMSGQVLRGILKRADVTASSIG